METMLYYYRSKEQKHNENDGGMKDMSAMKFDLVKALEEKGFEMTDLRGEGRGIMYRKVFTKNTGNAWDLDLRVTVYVFDGVCAANYFEGSRCVPFKHKEHLLDKRAYNAIKATVELKGFEF